jgi:hypothetical protein
MRKFLIPLAAAASAVAVAAPASAQYYGGSPGNDYGRYEYGRGYDQYGYGDNRGGYESRRLIAVNRERMARIHGEIESAAARGRLNSREAANLHRRASQFDRELAMLARGGMTGQEGAMFDARADRLAQDVRARAGYGYSYSYDRYNRW